MTRMQECSWMNLLNIYFLVNFSHFSALFRSQREFPKFFTFRARDKVSCHGKKKKIHVLCLFIYKIARWLMKMTDKKHFGKNDTVQLNSSNKTTVSTRHKKVINK